MLFCFSLNSANSLHYQDSYQAFGHELLASIYQYPDSTGEDRQEKPSSVLRNLSKFGNLAPLARDRELFRRFMGKDDTLTSDCYLLNPLDVSMLTSALLLLPKFERTLFAMQGLHNGSPVSSFSLTIRFYLFAVR